MVRRRPPRLKPPPHGRKIGREVDAALEERASRDRARRHEQQDAENVGEETGDQQKEAGDKDHDAVGEFAARIAPGFDVAADARHDAEPLEAQQHGAGDAGRHDEPERREHADLPADKHEAGDFQEGKHEQEEGDEGYAHETAGV